MAPMGQGVGLVGLGGGLLYNRSARVLRRFVPSLDWEVIRVGPGMQSRVTSYPRAESNALTFRNTESLQDA